MPAIEPKVRRRRPGQALSEYVLGAGLLLFGAIAVYNLLDLETVMKQFIATNTWGVVQGNRIETQPIGAVIN